MKKLKDMNKTTKSNMLTYTMVIVIYLVVQGLVTTGNISSLLKGLRVLYLRVCDCGIIPESCSWNFR